MSLLKSINPFDVAVQFAQTWRRQEWGHKLGKKFLPKITARREAKRVARRAMKAAAGGEFFNDDTQEGSNMGLIIELLGSLARVSLPMAITYLDSLGIHVTGNETTTLVVAGVAWIGMQAWSIVRKVRDKPRATAEK